MNQRVIQAIAIFLIFLAGCSAQPNTDSGLGEVSARANTFKNYPQSNMTYLSFSNGHGFQVNFIGENGKAWLWYPGNRASLPEEWKRQKVGTVDAICWRHPTNSHNPVTGQDGGGFSCAPLDLQQKTIVSVIDGDPFNLKSGAIPYVLDRCRAPDAFEFDRVKFGC